MLNGSCKKGMLVFCLSVLAFNIRAEISSNANESLNWREPYLTAMLFKK